MTRPHRAALVLLLVLGCALAAAAAVGAWARVTVLDEDRYVAAMAPVARSAAVQRAVADKLDTAIAGAAGVDPLTRAVIRGRIDAFASSSLFPGIWDAANRRAHPAVVALLTGRSAGPLRLRGDAVYVDVGAAAVEVRKALQDRGLGPVAAAVPPGVRARVLLLRSHAFATARSTVDLLERLAVVLPVLAVACLLGHLVLSEPRRRGALRIGLGLAVTALLVLGALALARARYLDGINGRLLPHDAAAAILDGLFAQMRNGLLVVAAAGAAAAAAAYAWGRGWLSTRSRSAGPPAS